MRREKEGDGGCGARRKGNKTKTNPSLVKKKYPTASTGPSSVRRLANLAFIEVEWN